MIFFSMYKGKKIGLALSGGGYRAAAFHLGTLKALHQLGVLEQTDVISSVSGGSIVAASYMLHDKSFDDFEKSFRKKLHHGVLHLLFAELFVIGAILIIVGLYSTTLMLLLLLAVVSFTNFIIPSSKLIAFQYDWKFFKGKKVKDLPKHPILAINATDTEYALPFTILRDRVLHSKYHTNDGKLVFNTSKISVAKAVMASSCIPLFSPVCIGKKCQNSTLGKKVYLMDGGLYDNQGAHRIAHFESKLHATYHIISDAGNDVWNSKFIPSIAMTMLKGINILMRRIKNVQNENYIYQGINGDDRYAYIQLDWSLSDQTIKGFINHLALGNIGDEIIAFHGIPQECISALRGDDEIQKSTSYQEIERLLKDSIDWPSIQMILPTIEEYEIVTNIKTGLSGLSEKEIAALEKQAMWLTIVQMRLYFPYLINY